ncbi:hypothetical protein KAR91_26315 [Candidatus Pacearchaeota archaeon]|nr:hypothetical protein [Candidatus Pacearchaeota archaeon]
MSAEWWKLNKEQLAADAEAQDAKQIAYHNTFYGSAEAREVLFDLTNLCFEPQVVITDTLARINLLARIKLNCGFDEDSQMAAIEAESK